MQVSTDQFSIKVHSTEHLACTKAQCARDIQGFLQGNSLYLPSSVSVEEDHPDYAPVLPHMYASVKIHKEVWPARVIAASRAVSTAGLWVGRGLRAMLQGFENLWWEEMLKAGVALEEGQNVQELDSLGRSAGRRQGACLNKYTGGTKARMAVYDFETMYTCIPLDDVTERMHKLICEVFAKRNRNQPCRNQHVLGASDACGYYNLANWSQGQCRVMSGSGMRDGCRRWM